MRRWMTICWQCRLRHVNWKITISSEIYYASLTRRRGGVFECKLSLHQKQVNLISSQLYNCWWSYEWVIGTSRISLALSFKQKLWEHFKWRPCHKSPWLFSPNVHVFKTTKKCTNAHQSFPPSDCFTQAVKIGRVDEIHHPVWKVLSNCPIPRI